MYSRWQANMPMHLRACSIHLLASQPPAVGAVANAPSAFCLLTAWFVKCAYTSSRLAGAGGV